MNLFMPKLDPNAKQAFKAQRALDNVVRLRLVSAMIVGVVLWFAAVNFTFIMAGSRELTNVPQYTVLYVSFFGLNVYTLVRTFRLQRRATDTVHRSRYLERVVSGYTYLTLLLGASISLADQSLYGHAMVYTLTLLLTAFLLTDVRQLAIPLILSACLLLIGLLVRLPPGPERMHILQELVAYVPIAFVISRIVHSASFSAWHSSVRLQQQIRENERLNDELQDANRRLKTLARTDEVTGIANRRGLNMHLDKLLATSDGALQLSLIMIDIDSFKEYNDLYGHNQGDHVLAAVAKVLAQLAAELSGFVSRWGGEEFLYVGVGMDKEEVLGVCQQIQEGVRAIAIRHEGSVVSNCITVSQGACSMEVRNRDGIATCLRHADRALYTIKAAGRNGYTHCDGIAVQG